MKQKLYFNINTKRYTENAKTAKEWIAYGEDIHVINPFTNERILVNGAKGETAREKTDRENWEHCRRIAEELEYYADGLYYTCPDCGETVYIPGFVGDKFKCYHCGNVNDVDDFEQLGLWDFFDDVYNIDFVVNSRKEYEHCRIMIACGGPNIYINTWEKAVELYWWTDSAKYYLPYKIAEAVDEWAEEYYNCI